jgi:antitoxin MazE
MELFEAIVYGLSPIKIGRTFNERGGMKKDFQKNMALDVLDDELSSKLTQKKSMVRAGWGESSKVIARDSDDYLRLGDFPNPDDQELEW